MPRARRTSRHPWYQAQLSPLTGSLRQCRSARRRASGAAASTGSSNTIWEALRSLTVVSSVLSRLAQRIAAPDAGLELALCGQIEQLPAVSGGDLGVSLIESADTHPDRFD